VDTESNVVGLLALGEKRSELGFSNEDKALLQSAAASAAVVLGKMLGGLAGSGASAGEVLPDEAVGISEVSPRECLACGAVSEQTGSQCSACGHELQNTMLPLRPLGKYQLERRLGAGGMGVVYLARDLELEREVAVKTLPRLSPERALRLRREGRAMASINHPNAALIYGLEFWRGVPLLILEYLPGGTVRDRLSRARFTPREVVELGIALTAVLETAHASGLLHLDIKPSNVGYTHEGSPKLLDFGLARILEHLEDSDESPIESSSPTLSLEESVTRTGRVTGVVGTPAYLAPEAVLREPPNPSFDLWGLAVLLLEALTGHNPLRAQTLRATLDRVVRAQVPPILALRPDCPTPLAFLMDECLERKPSRRPRTARALRKRLESVLADFSSGAGP
jgi:serine/threonine protein kinase